MEIPIKIADSITASALIEGFYQNGEGNCVSIASIKASLMAFKSKPIFKSISLIDVLKIEMRDGFKLIITTDEYTLALRKSKFEKNNQNLFNHAILMFAAMAKRAQIQGNDNKINLNYSEAIDTLNNGEYYLEGPNWLGLNDFIIKGPNKKGLPSKKAKKFLKQQEAGIGKSPKHVWFSSNGLNDEYGIKSNVRWTTNGALAFDIEKINSLIS